MFIIKSYNEEVIVAEETKELAKDRYLEIYGINIIETEEEISEIDGTKYLKSKVDYILEQRVRQETLEKIKNLNTELDKIGIEYIHTKDEKLLVRAEKIKQELSELVVEEEVKDDTEIAE